MCRVIWLIALLSLLLGEIAFCEEVAQETVPDPSEVEAQREVHCEDLWQQFVTGVNAQQWSVEEYTREEQNYETECAEKYDKHKYYFDYIKQRHGENYVPPPIDPDQNRTGTEWLGIRFNGGNYGPGADLSLFTVRWENFAWEIIRVGFSMIHSRNYEAAEVYFGGMFGLPIFLDDLNQHELRLSLGILLGGMGHNGSSFGLILPFETSYVYHFSEHVALQVGATFLVPTMGDIQIDSGDTAGDEDEGPKGMATPSIAGFIGLRF